MKEGKYTKTLAKIQVGAIFRCAISREMLVCLIFIELRRRHVCVPLSGTNMAADTSVTQFCYERVNSSLEELMNIKFSFLIQLFTLDSKIFKKKKSLFNVHDNSLGHLLQQVNAVSRKRLEIEEYSISNKELF